VERNAGQHHYQSNLWTGHVSALLWLWYFMYSGRCLWDLGKKTRICISSEISLLGKLLKTTLCQLRAIWSGKVLKCWLTQLAERSQ